MGAEVIAVSHIQSSGPTFRREAYELFESIGAIDYSDRKPYFTFDVRIPPASVASATAAIRAALDPDAADELIAFLEFMDWEASFVFLGCELRDIGLPDPLATRNTLAAAQAFVRTLSGWRPDGSDNRTPSP